MIKPREYNLKFKLLIISILLPTFVLSLCSAAPEEPAKSTTQSITPIDRYALVTRHNPVVRKPDPFCPLSVGNGEFAFTADITGLQTFPDFYAKGMPLATQSQWGWHTLPNPAGYNVKNFPLTYFESHGRKVGCLYSRVKGREAEVRWLRANPHRLDLGRVGLQLRTSSGKQIIPEQLTDIRQTLDLWTGIITSSFNAEGHKVNVQTTCHPTEDAIAVRITSDLIRTGQLKLVLHFPYGVGSLGRQFQDWSKKTADWDHPDNHETLMRSTAPNRFDFERKLDNDTYSAALLCSPAAAISQPQKHKFIFAPEIETDRLEFVCAFSPKPIGRSVPSVSETEAASRDHWKRFWSQGGAIDLAASKDPRAHELERRIVLSQYLTAIQCAGSLPPQESGLTHNSWHGKFHLEMHWWHAVHFALWGRIHLLEKSLPFYKKILPNAQARAKREGYTGARWEKCMGPDAVQMPSYVEPFLIWQQGHPIYYAELCYRAHADRETLENYKDIVFESAEFMASFAAWDQDRRRYVLGPPVVPASENYLNEKANGLNPAYGLAYWHFGLEVARKWRQRLGLPPNREWDRVLENLSPLPARDGLYVELESVPDSFMHRSGHPSFVAPLGVLPGDMADREIMRRTLRKVMETWNWDTTWGWDFSMLAMTAARLGEGELAIDALMKDARGNRWLPNGHCYQFEDLPAYLPANGGLLATVAMMAAGWDGATDKHTPGFPNDGNWTVRWEGLKPMP
ncbi:MAG TPA: hypothetical protein VMW16_13250 [Sedimentisphaerales bacterium]|nr:hypothetical protein [Sedimentisphaerales bacterium]